MDGWRGHPFSVRVQYGIVNEMRYCIEHLGIPMEHGHLARVAPSPFNRTFCSMLLSIPYRTVLNTMCRDFFHLSSTTVQYCFAPALPTPRLLCLQRDACGVRSYHLLLYRRPK